MASAQAAALVTPEGPKTPRASGTFRLWFDMTEGLAGRLDAAARRFLEEGRGDVAGEAHCLATQARALGESALEWAMREPDEQRAADMALILALQRRAEELLT